MWGFFNDKSSYYLAERTKATEVAENFLRHCKAEVLLTDAYSGYTRATRNTKIKNAFCHAHARRKFIEAEINYAEQSGPMIEWYQKLFFIEKNHKHDPPELRLQTIPSPVDK